MNLKELSNLLNLSPTTVSRALNGYPEVRAQTRLRVQEAAQKHGYHPSASAKKLAMGKARAVGHVVPLAEPMILNPYFADFIAGAGNAYVKADYDMVISVVPEDQQEQTYREMARSRKVDGVIVHHPKDNDPRLPLLQELGLPFVTHGRVAMQSSSNEPFSYSWLDVNQMDCFYRASEFLLDLGHTKVGLINGPETIPCGMRRRDGFETAVAKRGISVPSEHFLTAGFTEPEGYRAAKELLASKDRPTGIVVSSVLPAMGCLRAIQEEGLTLGRDISIVTYDDQLSFLQTSGKPLFTAIRSSIKETGQHMAEILLSLIERPDQDPIQVLLEPDLVVGGSTGPAPASL